MEEIKQNKRLISNLSTGSLKGRAAKRKAFQNVKSKQSTSKQTITLLRRDAPMHPTDHYTALYWTLRDVSNYIVGVVCFGLV